MTTEVLYEFTSKGLKPTEKLIVTDFKGYEEISQPYEFDINLKSESVDIDLEEMLKNRCSFFMDVDGEKTPIHGNQ